MKVSVIIRCLAVLISFYIPLECHTHKDGRNDVHIPCDSISVDDFRAPREDAPGIGEYEFPVFDLDLDDIRRCLGTLRSEHRDICEKVEEVNELLSAHDTIVEENHEVICSKIEDLDDDLSLHDHLICSKIEDLGDDLSRHDHLICSKIEEVSEFLDEHDMIISEDHEAICSKIDILDDCMPIPITGPTTISQPGHYCLVDGFYVTNADGITISSDDVVLDLNGQVITGGDNSIFISGRKRVTVKNGMINNSTNNGIKVDACSSIMINNIKLSGSTSACSGIFIINSSGVRVSDCESVGWGKFLSSIGFLNAPVSCASPDDPPLACQGELFKDTGAPFRLENSCECIFEKCVARDSGGHGFALKFTKQTCLINCKSVKSALSGFAMIDNDCITTSPSFCSFSNNVFSSCVAQNNTTHGFLLVDTSANTFSSCISNRNGSNGIHMFAAGFNVIKDCICLENDIGIFITVKVADGVFVPTTRLFGNTIKGCSINNNIFGGILMIGAEKFIIRNCEFIKNGGPSGPGGTDNSGIFCNPANFGVICDCVFINNFPHGIEMKGDGSIISHCKFVKNEDNAIFLQAGSGSIRNKIISCSILTGPGFGIVDLGLDNVVFNTCSLIPSGDNYSLVDLVEPSPDTGTGFWANISQ